MKFSKASLLVCLTTPLLISGCLVPEKFNATINIQPDSSYDYHYTGTAVNAMIAAQIKKTGSIPPKVEESAKAITENWALK